MQARIMNRCFTSRNSSGARMMAIGLVLLCTTVLHAQEDRQEKERRETESSAGGKWTEHRAEDRMTAASRVRFELAADNAEDSVDQARIILYCTDGKMNLADFRPNVRMGRTDWPGFWGKPQMHV